jgi:hypothetical protein
MSPNTILCFFVCSLCNSISGCSADDEEDFYYTEIDLDSPLDSSAISSTGQSIEPMLPSARCCENCGCHSSLASAHTRATLGRSSPIPTSPLKRSPSTWMHLDMARPAHEDPEYRQRLARAQLHSTVHHSHTSTTAALRRRAATSRKASTNVLKMSSGTSGYLSSHSTHLMARNGSIGGSTSSAIASSPSALQQQNAVHLQHNLQHLQASLARHKRGRKATPHPSMAHETIDDHSSLRSFDHLQPFELQPVPVKRSKPIQVPALGAHRRPKSPTSFSTPFTVGSVQNSPRSYFHCISPSSLGSPSGSSCSSGSAVSFSSLCSVAAAASSINDHNSIEMSSSILSAPIDAIEADHSLHSIESYDSAYGCDLSDALPVDSHPVEMQAPDVQAELELPTRSAPIEAEDAEDVDESDELFIDLPEDDQLDELLEEREPSPSNELPAPFSPTVDVKRETRLLFHGETDALTKLAESAVHALVNVKRMQQRNAAVRAAAEQAAALQHQQQQQQQQQIEAQQQNVQQVQSHQMYSEPLEYTYVGECTSEVSSRTEDEKARERQSTADDEADEELDEELDDELDDELVDDEEDVQADDEEELRPSPVHKKRANYEALLSDHQYRQAVAARRSNVAAASASGRFAASRLPRMAGRPARYEQAVRRAYERRYSFTPVKIGSSSSLSSSSNVKLIASSGSAVTSNVSSRRPVGRPPKSLYTVAANGGRSSIAIPSVGTIVTNLVSNTASGLPSNRRPPGRPKGSGKGPRLLTRETTIVPTHQSSSTTMSVVTATRTANEPSDLNGSFDSTFNSTLGSSAEVESVDSGLGGTSSSDLHSPVQRQMQSTSAALLSNAALSAARFKNSAAKCRKKFGMENKHQWCTQCKWKKACSRVAAAVAAAAAAAAALSNVTVSPASDSNRVTMSNLV